MNTVISGFCGSLRDLLAVVLVIAFFQVAVLRQALLQMGEIACSVC